MLSTLSISHHPQPEWATETRGGEVAPRRRASLGRPTPTRRRLIERSTERGAVRWWKVAHRHRPRGLLQSHALARLLLPRYYPVTQRVQTPGAVYLECLTRVIRFS